MSEHEQWVDQYYQQFGDVYGLIWDEQIHTGFFEADEDLKTATQKMNVVLANKAEIKYGSAILNIGSGRGGTDRWLAEAYNASVKGLDINPKQIEKAVSRVEGKNISYVRGTMTALPFADRSFDYLWIQESFFHCEEKENAVSEFQRVLKSGGRIVLEDTGLGNAAAADEVQVKFGSRVNVKKLLSLEEYKSLFTNRGFKIIEILDLTENLAKTYAHIVNYVKTHKKELSLNLPPEYIPRLDNNLGFEDSQKLTEEKKLVCYGLILEKI